ncbi:hypothetical protein [Pseudokineococcus sp. 1T1Z-3]|uniref:hypothetical protein n=1 Tax=Pseudokineococcus sp. 1T1Z-3 TaxID=3132745 RepID=UPI00309D3543
MLYHHVAITTKDLECEGGEALLHANSIAQVVGDLRVLGFADVRRNKVTKVPSASFALTSPDAAALDRGQVLYRSNAEGSVWQVFER